jgi:hypothetical protein
MPARERRNLIRMVAAVVLDGDPDRLVDAGPVDDVFQLILPQPQRNQPDRVGAP